MGDRSEERTRESRSTEDLLEETERLLEEGGAETGDSTADGDDAAAADASGSWWRSDGDADEESAAASSNSEGLRSRLWPSTSSRGALSRLSPTGYFSPKAFLALVLVLGAGLIGGDATLPAFGRLVGMFAVAFVVGLATSKRRYLEVTMAGVLVGAVASLANYAFFAFVGSGQTIAALGAASGVLAGLVGYYFGRDFRDGLVRDL